MKSYYDDYDDLASTVRIHPFVKFPFNERISISSSQSSLRSSCTPQAHGGAQPETRAAPHCQLTKKAERRLVFKRMPVSRGLSGTHRENDVGKVREG